MLSLGFSNTRVSCLDFPGILALYPSSIARENYCFQMIDKLRTTFWTQWELQRQKHNTTQVRIFNTRTLLLCACLPNTKDACDCLHNTVFVTRTVLECSLMRWLVEKGAGVDQHPPTAINHDRRSTVVSRVSSSAVVYFLECRSKIPSNNRIRAQSRMGKKNKGCWYNEKPVY